MSTPQEKPTGRVIFQPSHRLPNARNKNRNRKDINRVIIESTHHPARQSTKAHAEHLHEVTCSFRSGAYKSSQSPGFHRRQRHRNSYKSSSADKTQIRSSHIPRYLGPGVEGQSKPLFARCPGLVAAGHCRACCVDHCRGLAAAGLWLACCGVDHSLGRGVGLLEGPDKGCCWRLGS